MAKRKQKSGSNNASGFVWMLFGLSIGLVVAAAVYVVDRRDPPAEMSAPPQAAAAPETEVVEIPAEPADDDEPHPASRFDFFDILPTFEVVLPEVEPSERREPRSIEEPGSYVLQAGSFTDPADAERRKANLALLGIESTLQRAEISGINYHRVIIGPTTDRDKLNRTRRQIFEADMDAIIYKISE
ncbi:MAG: SPOR domain-containing protein [Gammaproteobacteria bacterium]